MNTFIVITTYLPKIEHFFERLDEAVAFMDACVRERLIFNVDYVD